MQLKVYKTSDRKTIQWASGTSTEIFIYPSNGDFATRNFTFRISTATVEAEESTFTFFEGITRHLMILKGNLELIHEGRYTKQLAPFEQDTFFGEWPTKSKGKVTDFNLMLKNGATGSLEAIRLAAGETYELDSFSDSYSFLYLVDGTAQVGAIQLEAGDLVQFNGKRVLLANESSNLIRIVVNLE